MIIQANLKEAKLIYKKHMKFDFPDDEIPNYNRFIKLTEKNIHDVYLFKKDNENVAYFIALEQDNNILITHLAVMKDFRSKGFGKIFLEEIKNYFKNRNMIVVEVEAEVRAKDSEELNIIKRRKKFYLNAGFRQCENMTYILYNVNYDILIYVPNKENNYKNTQIKEIMKKIYKNVIEDINKLEIEIT